MAKYLIWSHEHGAWWRPNSAGYTLYLGEAGRYEREEAIRICAYARDGMRFGQAPTEIPVVADDALEALNLASKRNV